MNTINTEKNTGSAKLPLVVNFFAGPGAGKTTAAWELAAYLSKEGYKVEYVSEYAKELVWEKKHELLKDQCHVTETQFNRLNRLRGSGVEIIVTDSPILLGKVYGEGRIDKEFADKITKYYESFDNFNLVVKRGETYQTAGRLESAEQAKELDRKIIGLLRDNKIFYGNYFHDEIQKSVDRINTTFERLYGYCPGKKNCAGSSDANKPTIRSMVANAPPNFNRRDYFSCKNESANIYN